MIKKVAVFFNSKRENAFKFYLGAVKHILSRGIKVEKICVNKSCRGPVKADLAISIGGDGTVLYAARHIINADIPLLSVNAGGLGFLSGVEPAGFEKIFDEIVKDKYRIIERFFLDVKVRSVGRERRYISLNDCVIRARDPRAFSLDVYYNGVFLSKYFGDGLIISTPTGSTAYNLASQGPIIMPHTNVFSLTPICPHTLTHRPMILPNGGEIEIEILKSLKESSRIIISVDGQENFELRPGDKIKISRYPEILKSLVPRNFSYFEVLRKKLSWGERK
ncbi:MAG: NAD(+) kinase [Elusimicrobia bacterium CG08_land_8_20_14_0_20_51_18]|nr:MAG: NAD(+) kinase [Elusimicrobia bacterium CG08_land_8_20_14_0_20_51_18]